MKTLETLYEEVMQSETLKKEFLEAAKAKDAVKAFLTEHGCDAGLEELQTFMKEKAVINISDEDIDSVAGGKSDEEKERIACSVITLGLCEAERALSKKYDDLNCHFK